MSLCHIKSSSRGIFCAGLLAVMSFCGCQATMNGQTLPSATYLRDDIQYFPAGPEFLLPNQVRAIEEYNAQQAAFADDYNVAP